LLHESEIRTSSHSAAMGLARYLPRRTKANIIGEHALVRADRHSIWPIVQNLTKTKGGEASHSAKTCRSRVNAGEIGREAIPGPRRSVDFSPRVW